jgi:MPBQ/MSBQ methyltransferase
MKTSSQHSDLTAELNFELYFVTEVLKLHSLHYGYWDDGRSDDRIDLEDVRQAQARFTDRLVSFVPPETKTVLDVGAGVGDNARALSLSGRRVTAISPDRNHEKYFDAFGDPNIAFQRSKFEDFESAEGFDLLLFSESHRYFDRRVGLEKAQRMVSSGGHLLLSGMFRNPEKKAYPADFDVADVPYIQTAAEYGFVPVKISDITPNIFPTVELADRAITEILEPAMRFAEAYAMARSPWKAKLFRWFLSKEDKVIDRALRKLRRKTDPVRFQEQFRYVTILFKKQ